MRVLVTGGAGFLGGNVAEVIRDSGHDVIIFDRMQREGFKTIRGDLLNAYEVQEAVNKVENTSCFPTTS
jgi:dTDP-L-rhamnose 4-epimerase